MSQVPSSISLSLFLSIFPSLSLSLFPSFSLSLSFSLFLSLFLFSLFLTFSLSLFPTLLLLLPFPFLFLLFSFPFLSFSLSFSLHHFPWRSPGKLITYLMIVPLLTTTSMTLRPRPPIHSIDTDAESSPSFALFDDDVSISAW